MNITMFTISLAGEYLRGYQLVDFHSKEFMHHTLEALSSKHAEQLLFNTEKSAQDFLKRQSKDGTHIIVKDEVHLIEEFDIYSILIDSNEINNDAYAWLINMEKQHGDRKFDTNNFDSRKADRKSDF